MSGDRDGDLGGDLGGDREGDLGEDARILDRITELEERSRDRDRFERQLASARQELAEKNAELNELGVRLELERRDVARLDGLSLQNLFASILGNKERQLEKERQDMLAAKLRYDEALHGVEVLGAAVLGIESGLGAIGDLAAERTALLAEREARLCARGAPVAARLSEMSERLGRCRSAVAEIGEALEAGAAARRELREVMSSLSTAGNWGVWDMLGGGLITTAIKHGHIDRARASVHRAQAELDRFRRELEDVGRTFAPDIGIDGFGKFADFFFDGLIFDWLVQRRIQRAREGTEQTLDRLQRVTDELVIKRDELKRTAEQIVAERARLLVQR